MIQRNKKPKLSNEQVIQIRESYFVHSISMSHIARKYNVSKALIQQVIHSDLIKDNIPIHLKERRMTPAQKRAQQKAVSGMHNEHIKPKIDTPKKAYNRMKKRESRNNAKQAELNNFTPYSLAKPTPEKDYTKDILEYDFLYKERCPKCKLYNFQCKCENNL